jgi:hypothetical protein
MDTPVADSLDIPTGAEGLDGSWDLPLPAPTRAEGLTGGRTLTGPGSAEDALGPWILPGFAVFLLRAGYLRLGTVDWVIEVALLTAVPSFCSGPDAIAVL